MRYTVLTNFVNAYKEKMFLSNSTGGGKDEAENSQKNALTLQDLRDQSFFERDDITFDFEQFMRIYNFEKNRSTNIKPVFS